MIDHYRRGAVRKLVLAATAALMIAAPSIADAQQRSEQDRPPRPSQQDARKGGGFQGMLRDIAGARLDRAHAERGKKPAPNDKNGKKR
jgi:hypothetical protein